MNFFLPVGIQASDFGQKRGDVENVFLGRKAQSVRVAVRCAPQVARVFGDGDELESVSSVCGVGLNECGFHLALRRGGGDLNDDFVDVVGQVEGGGVVPHCIQVAELPVEEHVQEMKKKILRMLMQVQKIQAAAHFDPVRKRVEHFFDGVEPVQTLHRRSLLSADAVFDDVEIFVFSGG